MNRRVALAGTWLARIWGTTWYEDPVRLLGRGLWMCGLFGWGLWGCGSEEPTSSSSRPADPSAVLPLPKPVTPAQPTFEPNPLGLPARRLELPVGTVVYAVPAAMLRGAKEGSAFQLRATTVVGADQDWVIVDGGEDPDYPIHPSYLVVHRPGPRTPRLGLPVITELAGQLRHALVRSFSKNKIVVRFTDTAQRSERSVDPDALMAQTDGLHPGNYVAFDTGSDFEHLLLVAPISEGAADTPIPGSSRSAQLPPPAASGRWLTIGYGGASRIVDASKLSLIPVTYDPKVGTAVWAEHLGKLRRAVVTVVDKPGVFEVRFERAGPPVRVGVGAILPPLVSRRGP
jgi:hypothetical protein